MTLSALPDIAWNDGPKQECLERGGIAMSHDELAAELGASYQKIVDAGFVLMPRKWRDDVLQALAKRPDQPTGDK